MFVIVIIIHVIVCIALIFFVLIQSGRGGGLIESFSSAESIFGTKTNTFVTKTTTILAITFFITCLALAFFSIQQNKSIVERGLKKQIKSIKETQTTQETIGEKLKEQKETESTNKETDAATIPAATNQPAEPSAAQ